MEALIITLDGPAGSGKSTVARALAGRLGLEFLDTGAMYRGIAARVLDDGVDPEDEAAVAELAGRCKVRFDFATDPPRLLIDGKDMTHRLRDADVTRYVSQISAIPAVRKELVDEQQRIGREHPRLVTEGRDQGSVVFPDAAVKFYLDASPRVRAERRAEQLREAGKEVNEADVLEQIKARDRRDSTRPDAPLIKPHDAEAIDTSGTSLDQVITLLEERVRDRAGALLEAAS